jgi:hypothetical protein
VEVEVGRILVQDQPRQKVSKTPSQPITGHGGICLSSSCAKREAKIRRIEVPGQLQQISLQDPLLTRKKLRVVVCICHPNDFRKQKIGGSLSI